MNEHEEQVVEANDVKQQPENERIIELELEIEQLHNKLKEAESVKKHLANEQSILLQQKQKLQTKLDENQRLSVQLLERELELQKREAEEKANFSNYKLLELDRLKQELEKSLDKKRHDIERRKEALEQEFDRKREELERSLLSVEKNLVKRKEQIDKEIVELRNERLKELDLEYAQEQARLQQRLTTYRQDIESIMNEKQAFIDQQIEEMKRERYQFESMKKEIDQQTEVLRKKEAELFSRENDLKMMQAILQSDQEVLKETIERESRALIEKKDLETQQLRNKERMYIERINQLQKEIDKRDMNLLRVGSRTSEDLLHEIEVAKKEIYSLRTELQKRPDLEVVAMLEERSRQYDKIYQEYLQLTRKVQSLELVEHRNNISVAELEKKEIKYKHELMRRELLELQISQYEEELGRIKALHEQPKAVDARRGVIEEPYFTDEKVASIKSRNELQWLNDIEEKCRLSGMKFNRRLLFAFHTALKTSEYSPITVLAGVSGTGKSELPRLYSRFGGLYYLPLPVQPDWDSPQSLFGYFNSVDNRFNATPLIRSMVQFQQNPPNDNIKAASLQDGLLLVLLDEMNLAHVELYFSELLSKLETRRGESKPVNLDIDLGAGMEKYKVALSKNVLWVGTMNEDETTKSLSDKVLDRGNLISFPRPTKFEDRKSKLLVDPSPKLPLHIWESWLENHVELDEELQGYKTALEEINIYLEVVGRALGHRVWQSVKNYIGNHPLVIQAKQLQDEELLVDSIRGAFEEALVHKVMPKLRGIEVEGTANSQCLMPIKEKLKVWAPGLVHDFELATSNAYGVFIWRSAKYLEALNDDSEVYDEAMLSEV